MGPLGGLLANLPRVGPRFFDVEAFRRCREAPAQPRAVLVNLDEKDLADTSDNRKNGGARMEQKANGTAAKTEQRAPESKAAVSARGSPLPYFEARV